MPARLSDAKGASAECGINVSCWGFGTLNQTNVSAYHRGRYSQERAEMALELCVNVTHVYSAAPKCHLCLTLSA